MDFERAFSDYLDTSEYEKAESALFDITRAAFKAGWLAAQSAVSPKNKILEIKKSDAE